MLIFGAIWRVVVVACALFSIAHSSSAETPLGASDAFQQKVRPFLDDYCLSCHDEETKKGNVSLESLTDVSADNASMWKRIWEQVALKEMPPRKKTNQPKIGRAHV